MKLEPFKYPEKHFVDLREKLMITGATVVEKPHSSNLLCNEEFGDKIKTVIDSIASYLVTYSTMRKNQPLKKINMRPLSIMLLGPPGTGKSFFVKEIGEYLNTLLQLEKDELVPDEANIAEYERLESLGQVLIDVRNEKIDADYPPLLFLDEADADDETFRRLLTMLWDGRFFWGEHTRTLGASIIFLAVSSVICNHQFKQIVDRSVRDDLCNHIKEREIDKCSVLFSECRDMTLQGEHLAGIDVLWERKGTDFLSRVNGPIVFLHDLTLYKDCRAQIFKSIVERHFKDLMGKRLESEEEDIPKIPYPQKLYDKDKGQPRYSIRSLKLLAESLDASQIPCDNLRDLEQKEANDLYDLLKTGRESVRNIHFPYWDLEEEDIKKKKEEQLKKLRMKWIIRKRVRREEKKRGIHKIKRMHSVPCEK